MDWFLRTQNYKTNLNPIDKYVSMYRVHANHKSSNGGKVRVNEMLQVLKKNGYEQYALWFERHIPKYFQILRTKERIERIGLKNYSALLLKTYYRDVFKQFETSESLKMFDQIKYFLF